MISAVIVIVITIIICPIAIACNMGHRL